MTRDPTIPESDEDEPAPRDPEAAQATSAPVRSPRGRLLAGLALLLALASLGGAGYLYYELIYSSDPPALAAEVDALRAQLDGMDRRFEQLGERQQAALQEFRERQEASRAATERAFRESLAEVARQAPPATGEWQRAEAQYLLRIANHRLLMEHDVQGALRLLEAADAVLAELSDFALHEVRARLADEIAALEAVEGVDVEGLFLRLEAAKRRLDELPLRLPEYLKPEPPPPPPDDGFWSQLTHRLAAMVNVRRLGAEVKPLLAPEEGAYLELNLRLILERAQLAAVRRQQLIFEESLDTALDWIRRYLDIGKPPVRRLENELEDLRNVDLEEALPDISGSLNALQDVLRNPE